MKEQTDTEKLAKVIIEGILQKKGNRIIRLNLKKLDNAVADYFIICHGDSTTQVGAIADSVEEIAKNELNEKAMHKEGMDNAQWILLDYGDVVVHIFQAPLREFYNLEALWADAETTLIEE